MALTVLNAPGMNQNPYQNAKEQVAQGEKVKLRFGKWAGEGNSKEEALQTIRQQSYNEVMNHELKHYNAAGHLVAGPIQLKQNELGVTVAGSVPIALNFNANNPKQSYEDARIAKSAALAPSDPSGPDLAIALKAEANMGKAQVLIQNLGLNADSSANSQQQGQPKSASKPKVGV
jgi:hypothetical protein